MPPTVVTVPDVPRRWKCFGAPGRRGDEREIEQELGHLLDHALEAFPASPRSPPCRSASVTTPTGRESQARMRLQGSARSRRRPVEPGDLRRAAADIEHDDRAGLRIGEGGAARDREIGLGAPVDDLELEAELLPDPVDESGAVVGEPAGFGRDEPRPRHCRAAILSRQTRSASMVRSMAPALRTLPWPSPSPRRTIREKASTTRNPKVGLGDRRRQLLVPRSRAA